MANIGKSTYLELVGKTNPGMSAVEGFALDHCAAKRVVIVPWTSRQLFVRQVLEYAQVVGGAVGSISRKTPHPYPDWANPNGQPFLWCSKCDPIEGLGVPAGGNMKALGLTGVDADIVVYNQARITMQYEALPYDVIDDADMRRFGYVDANGNADESTLTRYVIRELSPGGTMITMPKGSMKFVAGVQPPNTPTDLVLNLNPPKFVPFYNVKVTHVHIPTGAVNTRFINQNLTGAGAIDNALGKVNSVRFPTVTGGGLEDDPVPGFPPGSLLYVACVITPHISPLGLRVFDVQHHWQFAQNLHNFVPYLSAANVFSWVELSSDGMAYPEPAATGKHIYDSYDMTRLFRPGLA